MPLIEGLGDEVTLLLATLFICVVVTLAWFSTHTADLPALREVGITVIERTQIRRRVVAQPGSNNDRPADNQNLPSLIESVPRTAASGSEEVEETSSSERSSQERDVSSPDERDHVATSRPTTTTLAPDTSPDTHKPNATSTETSSSGPSGQESLLRKLNSDQQQTDTKSGESHQGDQGEATGKGNIQQCTPESVSSPQEPGLPVEEEVRRRRVQFFQNTPSSPSDSTSSNDQGASCDVDNKAFEVSSETGSNISVPTSRTVPKPPSSNNSRVLASNEPTQSSPVRNGGGTADVSDNIRVRLKYMNETQRLVYTSPLDTIGNFRRTHFQQELQEGDKWVRFIFNGQDLRDDEATLQAYQVGDNCTMHCLITNKRRAPSSQTGGSGGGLHGVEDEDGDSVMGTLMYPLFTLVLAVVWYFRLTYRQYFSPMSTVCLIGISFLLGLGYFSSLRTAAAAAGNPQGPPSTRTGDQPEARQNRPTIASGHSHSD